MNNYKMFDKYIFKIKFLLFQKKKCIYFILSFIQFLLINY